MYNIRKFNVLWLVKLYFKYAVGYECTTNEVKNILTVAILSHCYIIVVKQAAEKYKNLSIV